MKNFNKMEKNCTCRVCGSTGEYPITEAKEWRQGIPDTFEYFKCEKCGCLQISEIPSDMARYYEGYYASKGVKEKELFLISWYRSFCISSLLKKGSFVGSLLRKFSPMFFYWVKPGLFTRNSKILDLGCGSGRLLLKLKNSGFKNVEGAEPYIDSDLSYQNGLKIKKADISELTDTYDLIMLHHVLEHMPDQDSAFDNLRRILNPDGTLLINIPVIDSYAWREYGSLCFQLEDAPRHFYLHSEQSVRLLADKYGFEIEDIRYYGDPIALRRSDQKKQFVATKDIKKKALELAEKKDSGFVCFYLKHKK